MSSIYSMHRPGFWRVPQSKGKDVEHMKKKVHFKDEFYVHPNSPAERELMRGDIITKVEDYDARDLRHEDAQMLFRTQDNKIRLVVRRDNKIAMNSSKAKPISSLPPPNIQPSYIPPQAPYRAPSPLPRGQHSLASAYASPIDSLPHTVFPENPHNYHQQSYQQPQYQQQQQQQPKQEPHVNYPPPPPPRSCFSPQLTRDYYQTSDDENASLQYQPYRSTPLVLPGAKVYHSRNLPTESYMRHHPNPQMRTGAGPNDFSDVMMKQKVADSVLHRVVGNEEADAASNGPKVVHKQFNSPIGLYSESNIENTIKNTVSPLSPVASSVGGSSSVPSPNGTLQRQQLPTKIQGYKKTLVYDPMKSETFRAVQENLYVNEKVQAESAPVQPRVFKPNRLVPGKKPVSSFPPPDPIQRVPTNSLGEANDIIHQSGSFKRLMYSVLGETEY